jgi:regulator of protease activity HflC (stomatin/prohibitin superfamily)
MERHTKKNGLVNLLTLAAVFVAALAATVYSHSLAGQAACVFLGLGVLIAFVGWFQMRLEENEWLEKLEVEELARSRGESALFESKNAEVFPIRHARELFEKFFIPGFCVLLFVLEGGGAFVLWRWINITQSSAAIPPERTLPAISLFAIFSLLLFLFGRFSVTMARLEGHRLLRPSASFLLLGAYICFATALGIAGVKTEFPRTDFYVARALAILLGLMAVEMLVMLLLEIYRPRIKGKVSRPLYDSRLVGLLAQPESLFTAAAQALDYQFGFKVSETWFFQIAQKSLPALLLAQLAALFLFTSVVFVDPGEQGVRERFGKLEPGAVLNPGAHFKWPWPIDKIYRYRTDQIQTFNVGFAPTAESEKEKAILWSVVHTKEQNFLVGNVEPTTITNGNSSDNDMIKLAPVSLIDVSIPVQFQITNVLDWAYQNAGETNLLEDLATRAMVHYLAGVDLNAVLSHLRVEAAQQLKQQIQADANDHRLGVKILFVGVQDIHPPVKVASDYEQVVAARQQEIAQTNDAVADAIHTNSLADAAAFTAVANAQAAQQQIELSEFARADLFTNQLNAYDAAPSVYQQRAYFRMFASATANARKYILLTTNTRDVVVFDLEDKIREDLLNLNVTNSP